MIGTIINAYHNQNGKNDTLIICSKMFHRFNAVVKRDESTKHQHRPVSYDRLSNNIPMGYDSPSSPRYSADRSSYPGQGNEDPRRTGSSGYSPGVGYSVSHIAGKKPESILPY